MIKEIQSYDDAKDRVTRLFGATKGMRLTIQDDIDDYARIAWFLSQKALVKNAMAEVSKQVWIRYNLPALQQSANRFSQALIRYGSDEFGFAVQSNVVFIGPLNGPEFTHYVRNGVMWKDTFALDHGEFSHSFQWLAIGQALDLKTRTAYLYKKCAEVFSNSDQMATRGESSATLARARQPLWAWLVDCFPPAALAAQIADNDNAHVFSQRSCRVPNNTNNMVRDMGSWFLGLYTEHRRDRLKAFATSGKELRREAGETEELDSSLRNIVKYQGEAYPAKGTWTKQMDVKSRSDPNVSVSSGNVLKKTTVTDSTKGQIAGVFHGIRGHVSANGFVSNLVM